MVRLIVSLVLLVTLLSVSLSPTPARNAQATQSSQSFLLGLLRADGVLIPFAKYQAGAWSTPWPKPADFAQAEPNSLANLPTAWFKRNYQPSPEWYFWPPGQAVRPLKISRTVRVDNHCQSNWGLRTDYPGRRTLPNHTHQNLGLALEADHKVESLIKLPPKAPERRAISSAIKSAFARAESAQLKKASKFLPADFLPAASVRQRVPLKITRLYRSQIELNGQFLYYVEAEKSYPPATSSSDQSCPAISFFKGWLWQSESNQSRLINSELILTDCDRKNGATTLPLGVLPLNNRLFLIVENHGYEDESYSILEVTEVRIRPVLEVFGGGC